MSKLLTKLSRQLWSDCQEQLAFIAALTHPQPFHPCILWITDRPDPIPFHREKPLPWQPPFVDRLGLDERPGQHFLHQQGAYYCLDYSSVFAAAILAGIDLQPQIIVDLCAAPGGKSILAWRSLQPRLLISNEVIGKRVGMLIGNLKRCQIHPVRVLSVDTHDLAEQMASVADIVLVDAPCTGQSLLAKGESAPGCFHPVAINHNAKRQRRILANAAQLVIPSGYLAYMTCAFSIAENEQVCAWFTRQFPHFVPQTVSQLHAFQSHLTTMPCYRMWPQSGLGAGAFAMLLKNTQRGEPLSHNQDLWLKANSRWQSTARESI